MAVTFKSRRCVVCLKKKKTTDFYTSRGTRDGLKTECKICYCAKRIGTLYRNEIKHRRRAYRRMAIGRYGGKCECCGETQFEFLSIDHIDGGGTQHRKKIGTNIGLWLHSHEYPVGFRILCHNCNQAIGVYGFCPHAEKRREQMS